MGRLPILLLAAIFAAPGARAQISNMIWVPGGVFRNSRSNYFRRTMTADPYIGRPVAIDGFYIGKFEVTQREWAAVMGGNPSTIKGDDLPVETVSWYDCVEYCNRRSRQEGLRPYYTIDKGRKDPDNRNEIDSLKWTVTTNAGANGYRLPTEAEWEYAASGGQRSRNSLYSGSDDVGRVAWYWMNSGDRTLSGYWSWAAVEHNHDRPHPVGEKEPNELGLCDMSGNVREWCWNWYGQAPSVGSGPESSAAGRVWRGGGWMGGDFCCACTYRAAFEASGKGPDQGLRVCRDK